MTIRELEALVAEKVMGWVVTGMGVGIHPDVNAMITVIPSYASTWAGMGLVVEKMRKKGRSFKIITYGQEWPAIQKLEPRPLPAEIHCWNGPLIQVKHPSVFVAVSLAALRAVGVEIPDEEVPR